MNDLALAEVIARLDILEEEARQFMLRIRQVKHDLFDSLDTDDETLVD